MNATPSKILLRCAWCGAKFRRRTILFLRDGPTAYCGRKCSGIARRKYKSVKERKSDKREYDILYRKKNFRGIKARKREYFQRTYDPTKAAIYRKRTMPRHVEYCRQPKYRQYKSKYDLKRRNTLNFGPFADCALILRKVESAVAKRMSKYEIRLQQGTLCKTQKRKRKLNEKAKR